MVFIDRTEREFAALRKRTLRNILADSRNSSGSLFDIAQHLDVVNLKDQLTQHHILGFVELHVDDETDYLLKQISYTLAGRVDVGSDSIFEFTNVQSNFCDQVIKVVRSNLQEDLVFKLQNLAPNGSRAKALFAFQDVYNHGLL